MIKIVTGHFGSGKTELALNMALEAGKGCAVVDIDIVNPYFRTNDVRDMLAAKGIDVIASRYASSNVDIPIVPAEALSAFERKSTAIFDVGGDADGAAALGRFHEAFCTSGYEMLFVVNTRRPLTRNADEIIEYMREIEAVSRLEVTGVVNSTNLGDETTAAIVNEGVPICMNVCEKTGKKFMFSTAAPHVAKDVEGSVKMIERYMTLPY
ncbi:MAG: hypothetical protein Q4C12_06135 [Clostridia bacterium]|nr:hypothetical protein [Clostridia bacterium]